MAITNYFVDPVGGDDILGTGAIGNPWQTVQHALDTIAQGVDGDQVNVMDSGSASVAAGGLSLAIYGAPGAGQPLVLRGYTAAANDGGIGVLDGGSNANGVFAANYNYVAVVDMRISNFDPAASILNLNGIYNAAVHVWVDSTCSGTQGIQLNDFCWAINCCVEAGSTQRIYGDDDCNHLYNYVPRSGTAYTTGLYADHRGMFVGNVVETPDSYGIWGRLNACWFIGNTVVHQSAGTGIGIWVDDANDDDKCVMNNYVEGFSGIGGVGIQVDANNWGTLYANNKVYNCTTAIDIQAGVVWQADMGNNGTVPSSGMTNIGGEDFTPTAVLQALAYPEDFMEASTDMNLDVGAAQAPLGEGGGREYVFW